MTFIQLVYRIFPVTKQEKNTALICNQYPPRHCCFLITTQNARADLRAARVCNWGRCGKWHFNSASSHTDASQQTGQTCQLSSNTSVNPRI